jgi:hypothetical protein
LEKGLSVNTKSQPALKGKAQVSGVPAMVVSPVLMQCRMWSSIELPTGFWDDDNAVH